MKTTRITALSAALLLGGAALTACTTVNVAAPQEAPASAAASRRFPLTVTPAREVVAAPVRIKSARKSLMPSAGFTALHSASAPVTCGVAMEVPSKLM